MKKYRLFFIVAAALLVGCSKLVTGDGPVITETRTTEPIFGIRLEGDADVEIVQGNTQSVVITGYENLVSIYETQVENGILALRFKDGYYNVHRNNIKVSVVVPAIFYIRSNGSGKIEARNFQNGTKLKLSINGSGNIYLDSSSFQTMELGINGSGDIRAASTVTEEADATIYGSGNIEFTCQKKITGHISGSGNINYWGTATDINVSTSGSGRVRKR